METIEKAGFAIRVAGEWPNLAETIGTEEVGVKVVRNTTLIFPTENGSSDLTLPFSWKVPAELFSIKARLTPVVYVSEFGGGMSNTGDGRTVCDKWGRPLKPFYTPKGTAWGEHAIFSVAYGVNTVSVHRHHDDIDVSLDRINLEMVKGVLTGTLYQIWAGKQQQLPQYLDKFRPCIDACIEKSRCYHCREAHYISA